MYPPAGWKKRWFVLAMPSKACAGELVYSEGPSAKKAKGSIALKGCDVFVPKRLRGTGSHTHCFCVTSQGTDEGASKASTTCTLLAASSEDELNKWMQSLQAAIQAAAEYAARADGRLNTARGGQAPGAVGGDAGATSLHAGAQMNLQQLKALDAETLLTLRIKQLKGVLDSMGIDYADCVEKKDLVAKIVNGRS